MFSNNISIWDCQSFSRGKPIQGIIKSNLLKIPLPLAVFLFIDILLYMQIKVVSYDFRKCYYYLHANLNKLVNDIGILLSCVCKHLMSVLRVECWLS